MVVEMRDRQIKIEDTVQSLQTLGTQPAIAMRLIELSKDLETELDDYVEVVSLCSSLSAKLISFSNSSWFWPRQPITTVKRALGMIGTNQLRALALSHCLQALHRKLELPPDDAGAYWEASVCKAVSARQIVGKSNRKRCDEMFAIGLLQDMSIGVMAAADPDEYPRRLRDPQSRVRDQLAFERDHFGIDHTEVGRMLSERLEFPALYTESIGAHHQDAPDAMTDIDPVRQTAKVVACLPHDMRAWNVDDIEQFITSLAEHFPGRWTDGPAFMQGVQDEFAELVACLGPGGVEPADLAEVIAVACEENVASTTQLVSQIQLMAARNNELADEVNEVVADRVAGEYRANHDTLTGVLNRSGFENRAPVVVAEAATAGQSVGLTFFDCDQFKKVNDRYGHTAGDVLLKTIVNRIKASGRESNLVCRWGGDEIIVLFVGLTESECVAATKRIQNAVEQDPVIWKGQKLSVSITGGLRWVEHIGDKVDLFDLIRAADENLYDAKSKCPGALVAA